MTNPDGNAVLRAIETLAHCPTEITDGEPTDYKLKILVRQAQTYIEACSPLWKAWKRSQEEGA